MVDFYPISNKRKLSIKDGVIISYYLEQDPGGWDTWLPEQNDSYYIEQIDAFTLSLLKELKDTYREMLEFYCRPGTQAYDSVKAKLEELE